VASRVQGAGRFGWRYGIASLQRHSAASVIQIVALSLGFMPAAADGDATNCSTPGSRPFRPTRLTAVVNIQPDQRDPVRRFSPRKSRSGFSPMVRGRLAQVNPAGRSRPAKKAGQAARRARVQPVLPGRSSGREHGDVRRWFEGGGRQGRRLGERAGQTLGLKVGDRLEFSVAGRRGHDVVGLRKLNWDSMRNFFVLTPPACARRLSGQLDHQFSSGVRPGGFVGRLVRAFQSDRDRRRRDRAPVASIRTGGAGGAVRLPVHARGRHHRALPPRGIQLPRAALRLAIMRAGARRGQLQRAVLAEFAAIGGLRADRRAGGDAIERWRARSSTWRLPDMVAAAAGPCSAAR
jgi:putative ABC transport system permease protein